MLVKENQVENYGNYWEQKLYDVESCGRSWTKNRLASGLRVHYDLSKRKNSAREVHKYICQGPSFRWFPFVIVVNLRGVLQECNQSLAVTHHADCIPVHHKVVRLQNVGLSFFWKDSCLQKENSKYYWPLHKKYYFDPLLQRNTLVLSPMVNQGLSQNKRWEEKAMQRKKQIIRLNHPCITN